MPNVVAFALLAVLMIVVVAFFPWMGFIFIVALGKGFAALGVALLLRAGLISIGHALYFGFGAYVTAFLSRSSYANDLAVLIVIATLSSAAIGFVIGAFMVRYRSIFFAMLNLALSMVFFSLLSKLYNVTGGTDGLRVTMPTVFGMAVDRAVMESILLYGGLALLAAVAALVHRYLQTPLGQALSAVHTNELRLEYLGVSVWRVLLTAYGISAALAGLGGALTALAIGHVLPEVSYWTMSGQLVLIAVLGGIGGAVGPFIGAVFFEVVHTLAVGYVPDAWNLMIGVALILVIFFLPGGLYGLFQRAPRKQQAGT
jgi:ABC-type branched-subunit amino acid transport system permease subunit